MEKFEVRFKESLGRISEVLENVKQLLNFSEKDIEILKVRKDLLKSWSNEIIEDFYANLLKSEKAREIIEKNNIDLNKLKEANKRWYEQIASGNVDEKFFRYSFYVGLLHIYYDVDNHLMILMADVLKRKFLKLCLETFDEEEAFEVYQSFSKVVSAFVGITVEGYIFMLKEALLDILGMKPELVNRLLKMELEQAVQHFRKKLV